jgi:hypothetical protein
MVKQRETIDPVDQEVGRLLKLWWMRKEGAEDLLTEALAGRERTVKTVTGLMGFINKHIGHNDVTEDYWSACGPFLEESGVSEKELQTIRRPYKVFGDPGFESIFDEMAAEGHDIPAHLLSGAKK